MLNFGLLSVENTWMTNTTPINLEQFKSMVPFWLLLNGLVTIYTAWKSLNFGMHFPNRFSWEQYNLYRHISTLNWIVSHFQLPSCIAFMNFQIPQVHSPNHYRNILSLNNRRQWDRYPLSVKKNRWLTSSTRALFLLCLTMYISHRQSH